MGEKIYKDWQYSLSVFDKLANQKKYALRFRLEYAFLLMQNKSVSAKFKTYILHLLAFFNQLRYILKYSKSQINESRFYDIIFLVSNNRVYLQHLIPIMLSAKATDKKIIIFCPAKHFNTVKEKLPDQLHEFLFAAESINFFPKSAAFILKLLFLSFADLVWFAFRGIKSAAAFSSAFARYSLIQFAFEKDISALINKSNFLVSANDHWMWESLFFTIAKNTNVKSIVIQHGVTGEISYPLFASCFAAWGDYDKEKMIDELGAKPEEVKAVGSPYFNAIYNKIHLQNNSAQQFDKEYITFLAQPALHDGFIPYHQYQEIVKTFCQLQSLAANYGKKIIVKLHPAENASDYTFIDKEIEISASRLYDVLENSCLVFTIDSTSVFEAAMFGIPSFQLFTKNQLRKLDFSQSGISKILYTDENIYEVVENLLRDKNAYMAMQKNASAALGNFFLNTGETNAQYLQRLLT